MRKEGLFVNQWKNGRRHGDCYYITGKEGLVVRGAYVDGQNHGTIMCSKKENDDVSLTFNKGKYIE